MSASWLFSFAGWAPNIPSPLPRTTHSQLLQDRSRSLVCLLAPHGLSDVSQPPPFGVPWAPPCACLIPLPRASPFSFPRLPLWSRKHQFPVCTPGPHPRTGVRSPGKQRISKRNFKDSFRGTREDRKGGVFHKKDSPRAMEPPGHLFLSLAAVLAIFIFIYLGWSAGHGKREMQC